MKTTKAMRRRLALLLCAALALSGCGTGSSTPDEGPDTDALPGEGTLEAFADVRAPYWFGDKKSVYIAADRFHPEDMASFTFNEGTTFEGSEDLQAQLLEDGKNPGLGVRALHAQGITGQGVRVAIIDQNLLGDHPEYAARITALYRSEQIGEEEGGSMHGPAVASLLVGESIGVAPGAELYYAAVPDGTEDAGEYARALWWIIEQNEALPDDGKIRVVSVSAAPCADGPFTEGFELYEQAVADALAAGILVLDTRDDPVSGIFMPAFFDLQRREEPAGLQPGFVTRPMDAFYEDYPCVGVPCDYRTVAEQYREEQVGYAYTGSGGLSWGIPYGSGLLALGWQIAPEMAHQELVGVLMETAHIDERGNRYVYPEAFVRALQQRSNERD